MALAVLERALDVDLAALVGHEQPQHEVEGDAHPEEDREEDEARPDDEGVDAEPAGQARRDAGEPATVSLAHDPRASQSGVETVEAVPLRRGVIAFRHVTTVALPTPASHEGRP